MFKPIIGAMACLAISASAQTEPSTPPDATTERVVDIGDVERFFRLYDATGGRPTAEQLQRDYLDAGSDGLKLFASVRDITGTRIADSLARNPGIYANARRCLAVLPRVRERVAAALDELSRLYPAALFPPVTIAVGRGKPVAVGSPVTGIQVGLEALCAADWLNPDLEGRFVHVIAHEYAHVQQSPELADHERPTVLQASLIEGVAELVAELTSGEVAYSHLAAATAGRETEIETAFVADQDKADLSDWLFNTTPGKPGDLGYWVGYRIAKAYYQRASDKHEALREILEMNDPKAFVERSGWYPGIRLQ